MIKANDCRYGNYIEYGGSITKLNEKEMCHFFRFPETYKPIPLTEDWLFKFGFEKDLNLQFYKNFKNNKTVIIDFCFICLLGNSHVKINYVHELQNLYFALTKTELSWQNLEK
jgi:hypothetical protein